MTAASGTSGKHSAGIPAQGGNTQPASVPSPDAADQLAAERDQGGVGEFIKVSGNLAKAAGAITRRLTVDLGKTALNTGKDVFEGARKGQSTDEIAATVLNDIVEGARDVLGFDEDMQRMATELKDAAKPMANYMPEPVKNVAEQVSQIAPVKAVTDMTGLTVQDVRRGLRDKGRDLLRRSTQLDDPDEHPALSVLLDEISPDEARVVRFLGEKGPQAVIDVVASNPMTRKKREMAHNYSLVGREAGCIRPQRANIYLDNLERLGIVAMRPYRLRSTRNYDLLICQPEIADIKLPPGRLVKLKHVAKGVELSEFGKELFRYCLESETSHLAEVPDEL